MTNPLADRIRPESLEQVVGQQHLLGPGKALRQLIESGDIPNLIFYGPPGVGKTTVASIIAKRTDRALRRLNGTNASTADIRALVAELDTLSAPNGILLYLDEIQYFNKRQQQSLLEYIENGKITLIASTTENPYFYIYPAVLSRCTVFEFKSVTRQMWCPRWSGASVCWRRRTAPRQSWRTAWLAPWQSGAAVMCASPWARWKTATLLPR